jgi:hypothetical protein
LKINDKYLYEENKYAHNTVKIYGLLNILVGFIAILMLFVTGAPCLLIPFCMVLPLLFLIIGIYWFRLKRFQITMDYIQFPHKINGFRRIEFREIENAELIITDLKTTKTEDIMLRLKGGRTVKIRIMDDLNIDYFLKMKKVLNLDDNGR